MKIAAISTAMTVAITCTTPAVRDAYVAYRDAMADAAWNTVNGLSSVDDDAQCVVAMRDLVAMLATVEA